MRWFLNTLIVVLSVSAISIHAADSDKRPKTYLVGVEDVDYFPFFTKEENASPPGLMIDILNQFAHKEGLRFEYVYLPIARFPDWYDSAGIDFRIPDNPEWSEKTNHLTFSNRIVKLHTNFITLRDNQQLTFDEFNTIGTIKNFTPSPQWLDKIKNKEINFVYDNSVKVLILMLKQGLVDALDINISVGRHYGRQLGLSNDDIVIFNHPPNGSLNYHLSTIKHADVIDRFNQFLVENDDEILALKTKYQILLD